MTVRIITGNCLEQLALLDRGMANCCVTSPPYWGLRDYGTEPVEWPAITYSPLPGLPACAQIPAMRCSLGLDPTLEAFIGHMVLVFRGVREVLRDDGTLWMNMGDSYAGLWGAQGRDGGDVGRRVAVSDMSANQVEAAPKSRKTGSMERSPGLKPKDLVGQPWRLALALQADGWWLRQDVIWHKPNPMPESVRDRCTKAHEYVFLLAKSERYYYDFESMQEPASENTNPRRSIKAPDGWDTGAGAHGSIHRHGREKGADRKLGEAGSGTKNNDSFDDAMAVMPATRNTRSVWTVGTEAFKEAHFATFPTALIEPCIKAGCPEGGTVLDPFGGAGTTGLVADRLQRNAVLIELNHAYAQIARRRIEGDAPLFTEVAA